MRIALAAKGFINGDIHFNKGVIIETMIRLSNDADLVLFGEAFLQGFYGPTFDVEHDERLAISREDIIIKEICSVANKNKIAVSFGFIEKCKDCFYSSQITIDSGGEVIDVYQRVSPGWKLPIANAKYCEGKSFHSFKYMNNRIVVGLCGDLWFDENIDKVKQLSPDIVFWPVYTDFNYEKWNTSVKCEYAERADKMSGKVLYVNSVCKDKEKDEIARGGAVLFVDGKIREEIPAGKEDVLIVDV